MKTTLDHTFLAKITSQSDMDEFVASLDLKSDTVIIKPNWVEAAPCAHTEAKVLDLFLNSVKNKKIYIVESYTFWRHQQFFENQTDAFSSKEAQFETAKIHWDFFKTADNWFLKHTGIDQVLEKHHATFINITNELWSENSTNLVPQKLQDLKGADFVSFAKLKGDADYGATLSIKNIFGLYPDPNRSKKYHGTNEDKILVSILEINKIYQQLFNCYFVVEGVYNASYFDWAHKENTKTFFNLGFICGGHDAVQVDDTVLKTIGLKFKGPLANLLPEYQKLLGGQVQPNNIPLDYKFNFNNL